MAAGASVDAQVTMTDTLAIALAQLNPTVGDLEGNKALILRARAEAAARARTSWSAPSSW